LRKRNWEFDDAVGSTSRRTAPRRFHDSANRL
jgi:hypothetical protein